MPAWRPGSCSSSQYYNFRYLRGDDPHQAALSLVMPATRPTYQDADLFPVMEQNLPEGDLYLRLRSLFPKQALTPMHLLALIGANGIGRLGFGLPGGAPVCPRPHAQPCHLIGHGLHACSLRRVGGRLPGHWRRHCWHATEDHGARPCHLPIPTLIVKAASAAYPGLAANEFLCLSAARRAQIEVPGFDLSHDGQMLVLDRFDVLPDGSRLGFEDIAALMGLRVRDTQSDRKYQGSCPRVAELLQALRLPASSLQRLFDQVAFTAAVRNGDGHLKNFGVLYTGAADARLAPMPMSSPPPSTATGASTAGLNWKTARWRSSCLPARARPAPTRLLRACWTSAAASAGWRNPPRCCSASPRPCAKPWRPRERMSVSRENC